MTSFRCVHKYFQYRYRQVCIHSIAHKVMLIHSLCGATVCLTSPDHCEYCVCRVISAVCE